MKVWIEACRPRTLPLSAAGVMIAAGLAAYWGYFRVSVFVIMLLMVLLLQIMANFADEYGDLGHGADNESRVGPKRGMQRGEITKETMKRALVVVGVLCAALMIALLLVSFGLSHWDYMAIFVALGALCIIGAIKYTVGRGAYGYRALGDLATMLFFGLIAVVGGFFLYSLQLVPVVFLPAVGLGCLAVGVLNLNNMRDRETDAAAGKKTIAVMLGRRGAVVYHSLLLSIGVACFIAFPLVIGVANPLRWLYLLLAVPILVQLSRTLRVTELADYDSLMRPLSMNTALLALAFALCMGI